MKRNKVIKEDIIKHKYRRKEKMSLISTYRFIRLKIEDVRHYIWRKRLRQTDFTIISNNCWGG